MEFKVNKTFYKTNEYLNKETSLLNLSNFEYLINKYNYKKIENLDDFNKEDSTFIIKENLSNKFKRPKLIIFENKIFIRDDLYFILEDKMNKDPVLDYNTLIKLEKKVEDKCLDKLYSQLKNVNYNEFINEYNYNKNLGFIEIDLNLNIIKFDFVSSVKTKKNKVLFKND